jgi:hypothetical protein
VSSEVESLPDDHHFRPKRRSAHGLAAIAIAVPKSTPFASPAVATAQDNSISSPSRYSKAPFSCRNARGITKMQSRFNPEMAMSINISSA